MRSTAPADPVALQMTPRGRLRHLLTLRDVPRETMALLLQRASDYLRPPGALPAREQALAGRTVANLFFEPSTRTRASFELAAKRMGADVLSLDVNMSSRSKGESLLDTIYTLQAMQVDIFVVRDAGAGVPAYIARHAATHVSVLNAGEAEIAHPTQGLLDLMTVSRHKPDIRNLTVTIVGDILHSRVARSAEQALRAFGLRHLRLVAPAQLMPHVDEFQGASRHTDLAEGVRDSDVVMALRIQRERIRDLEGIPDRDEYYRRYGITRDVMKLARLDAIVMHPGPMNRGVEIEGAVADGPQSVIVEQVTNGVAMRMAVLATVTESLHAPL